MGVVLQPNFAHLTLSPHKNQWELQPSQGDSQPPQSPPPALVPMLASMYGRLVQSIPHSIHLFYMLMGIVA